MNILCIIGIVLIIITAVFVVPLSMRSSQISWDQQDRYRRWLDKHKDDL